MPQSKEVKRCNCGYCRLVRALARKIDAEIMEIKDAI